MKLTGLPKTKTKKVVVPENLQTMVLEMIEFFACEDMVWDEKLVGSLYTWSHVALGKCCNSKKDFDEICLLYGQLRANGRVGSNLLIEG